MRQKPREIRCLCEHGQEVLVIEWGFGASPKGPISCREFRLEDGSPVNYIGSAYEHFYTGRVFTPAGT